MKDKFRSLKSKLKRFFAITLAPKGKQKICEVDIFTKSQIVFLGSSEGARPFIPVRQGGTLYEVQGSHCFPFL